MEKAMRATVTEMATRMGVERADLAGVVNLAVKQGKLTKVGEQRQPNGKGRAVPIYEFPDSITLKFVDSANSDNFLENQKELAR